MRGLIFILLIAAFCFPLNTYAAPLKACLKADTGKVVIKRRCKAAKGQQEINAEILACNCKHSDDLAFSIHYRADDMLVRGILCESILSGFFDMVDNEGLWIRFQERVYRVTQVIKQFVRFEQWVIVLVFMHRNFFACDVEENDIDV